MFHATPFESKEEIYSKSEQDRENPKAYKERIWLGLERDCVLEMGTSKEEISAEAESLLDTLRRMQVVHVKNRYVAAIAVEFVV